MRQKVQGFCFFWKALWSRQGQGCSGFWSTNDWSRHSSEAVTNLKAASLYGRHGGESWSWQLVSGVQPQGDMQNDCRGRVWDSAFKRGETVRGSFKGTKGEGKKLQVQRGRGQLRTPVSHLTVSFQSSRASAVPRNSKQAEEDTQMRPESSCSEHSLC